MIEGSFESIKASARREVEEIQRNYDRLYSNYSNLQAENTQLMTSNAMLHRENEALKTSARLASEAGFGPAHVNSASVFANSHFMPSYSTSAAPSFSTAAPAPRYSVPRYEPLPERASSATAASELPAYAPLSVTTAEPAAVSNSASITSPSKFSFSTYEPVDEAPSGIPSRESSVEPEPAAAPVVVAKARSRYFMGSKANPALDISSAPQPASVPAPPTGVGFSGTSASDLGGLSGAHPPAAPSAQAEDEDLPAEGRYFTLQELSESALFPGATNPAPAVRSLPVNLAASHARLQRQLLTPGSTESEAEAALEESARERSALNSFFD